VAKASTSSPILPIGTAIYGNATLDKFGASVSISADGTTFIFVGAPGAGQVTVYKFNPTNQTYESPLGYTMRGKLEGDRFGSAVSLAADGMTFVVVALGIGNRTEYVRIYKLNDTINAYTQFGQDISGGYGPSKLSECAVSMSADGTSFVWTYSQPYGTLVGNYVSDLSVFIFNNTANAYQYAPVRINYPRYSRGLLFGSVSISANGMTFAVGVRENHLPLGYVNYTNTTKLPMHIHNLDLISMTHHQAICLENP
jgi:hypothetical protein